MESDRCFWFQGQGHGFGLLLLSNYTQTGERRISDIFKQVFFQFPIHENLSHCFYFDGQCISAGYVLFFSDISSKTKGGSTSVVITDGAPVYPRLCRDHKLKHLSCNHSKGIFCTTKKNRDGTSVEVHTGSIDAMWRLCKMCIPPSLSSKNTSSLMRHLRQWQWRWSNGNKDLAQKLGKAIS